MWSRLAIALLGTAAIVIASALVVRADPLPPPTLIVAGEQILNGSNYTYVGQDGETYRVYSQTNLVVTAATNSYDDPALTYFGTWGTYTGSGKYGPGDHFTRDVAGSYGFLFTGTSAVVYTQTAPWMAIASFAVDGGPAAEFDAYAATQTQGVVAFRTGPLTPGTHRLIARHTGRSNPASATLANGGFQVTVDRVDIVGTIIAPLAP